MSWTATTSPASAALGGVYDCARLPPFIAARGIQQPAAIDTTTTRLPGLVIRELENQRRVYQGNTWNITGHIASTVRDAQGNIYVIPVPTIGLDINPLDKRNRVYKVDAQSGIMSLYVELPIPKEESQTNPFGTLGLALDCQTNSLYVSSVAGSGPQEVNGAIYQIDLNTGTIKDRLSGVDSIGLGVFNTGRQKRLYFGEARSSSVMSVLLSSDGEFTKPRKPRYEFSLLEIKNASSKQVKKIRFVKDDEGQHIMLLSDTEFSFRLVAETSRRSQGYKFVWQPILSKWLFLDRY